MAANHIDGGYVEQNEDEFHEAPAGQNGELIMVLARGVGVLVAIVAILSWFMIMMLFRAALAWLIHMIGVTGVCALVGGATILVIKYANISVRHIWVMLRYSCS